MASDGGCREKGQSFLPHLRTSEEGREAGDWVHPKRPVNESIMSTEGNPYKTPKWQDLESFWVDEHSEVLEELHTNEQGSSVHCPHPHPHPLAVPESLILKQEEQVKYFFEVFGASQVALVVKNLPAKTGEVRDVS